jgi:MoaA/NifB/PqqE/SkfB family radical SAM enzyme
MICRYLSFSGNRRGQYLYAKKQCENYIEKIGLKAIEAYNYDNDIVRYVIPLERMNVSVFVRDFQKCGVDRGGVLKDFSKTMRVSPCASPFKQLSIDWTGDVLSCCNLRGDIEAHKPYILGNAATETIQNIFYSEIANKLRGQLAGFGEKYGPCGTCGFQVFKYDTRVDNMMRGTLNNAGFYSDK